MTKSSMYVQKQTFIDSSETFAKSFDSLAILNSRNDPFRNIRSLHKPSFRVGLPRTVCGSVCLSVEKDDTIR